MTFHAKMAVVFLIVLGAAGAFTATANAAQQWDVPDYTMLSVKTTTPPIETVDSLLEALEDGFDDIDTDGDGFVSFAEAVAALPGLTRDVFDAVDTNGDGLISPAEAKIGGGCNCNGIDWSDPSAIIIAILVFLGLSIGWCTSGC